MNPPKSSETLTHPLRVKNPPVKPTLLYDGDCGFCRKWINRWRGWTGDRLHYEAYQNAGWAYPEIGEKRFEKAVQLIEPDGRVTAGAHAVFRALAVCPGFKGLLWAHDHLPGFAFISETLYVFVADHRHFFSAADACGLTPSDKPANYSFSRWLFLKVLALCYFVAFGSLWFQVEGLLGEKGILPIRLFLSEVKVDVGVYSFFAVPSLCWLNDSNAFLLGICLSGLLLSLLLFFDWLTILCLPLLWVLYLSLVSVGQEFLSFQWDSLLLEAGLLSVFIVPLRIRLGSPGEERTPRLILFLFQWLLFRLMFLSGVVKLASGDISWRNLTALNYHFETQPLPTTLAWYAQQLPGWVHQIACLGMFGIELAIPFFIFGPRRLRPWAFGCLAAFQGLIALTGNYGFFNLLTLGLCLFTLEDEAYPRWWKDRWASFRLKPKKTAGNWTPWITLPLVALVLYISIIQMAYSLGERISLSPPLALPYQILQPFRSINSYGLFAVMTKVRDEILVEGSSDGIHWLPYEFKWKPGSLSQPPGFVAPYQPRLDWQMWFAALGDYRHNPWIVRFLVRILQGSPEVLGLLKNNPFPGNPPKYIRAGLYEYHFTRLNERAQTGEWWKMQYLGSYLPSFSLEDIQSR